jgi:PIN domain nuclease of toxin-antitoxin system
VNLLLDTNALIRWHLDPFDRLLIVQAQEDGFTILSSDRPFEPCRVPVLWA